MPFFEYGKVRIRYEESGSGYPLLLFAPGGLNSAIDNWEPGPEALKQMVHHQRTFNPLEVFKDDFRLISMDQRNAPLGQSTGPIETDDPWGAYARDQLGLMDFLGIEQFGVLGFCIGCSFVLTLAERAPGRMRAAVLCQPIGFKPDEPDLMRKQSFHWSQDLPAQRPDVDEATAERMIHNMFEDPADFVFSVKRESVRVCSTPLLVIPGTDPPHPRVVALEVVELAPRGEIHDPWKSPEAIPGTVQRIRDFLNTHLSS